MKPEQRVKTKVRKALNQIPKSWFFAVIPGVGMIAGVPDYIGLVCGRFVGVEVKSEVGKLSGPQELVHKTIRGCGGVVLVVRPSTLQDMVDVLEEIERRHMGEAPRNISAQWGRVNP